MSIDYVAIIITAMEYYAERHNVTKVTDILTELLNQGTWKWEEVFEVLSSISKGFRRIWGEFNERALAWGVEKYEANYQFSTMEVYALVRRAAIKMYVGRTIFVGGCLPF
jgi:hypothetical protein